MNVAPPKPTRSLTEPERTVMLTHDISPVSPVVTPPLLNAVDQQLMVQVDQPVVHVVCNNGANPRNIPVDVYVNNVGWDAATEELLLSLDKQHLFPGLGRYPRLELLDLDSELIQAPLASPEALSAASSMSALSRAGSIPKGNKLESTAGKLATIQQSPEIHVRTEDSVEEVCEIDNAIANMSLLKCQSLNESVSVGDLLKSAQSLGVCEMDCIAHASQGSLNNLLPNMDFSNSSETIDDVPDISDPVIKQGATITELNPNSACPEISSLANDETRSVDQVTEHGDLFERHSPTETTQYGYFDLNEVYSPASVGYHPQISVSSAHPSHKLDQPSGLKLSTHPPNKLLQYSQSESRLKGLSDEYQMKRSTEEGDIAHLEDTSKVFVRDNLLKKVLKPRESEPAFGTKLLANIQSDNKLPSVQENDNAVVEKCDACDTLPSNVCMDENRRDIGNAVETLLTSKFVHNNKLDLDINDRTCLVKRNDSDTEDRTITEENQPKPETCSRKDDAYVDRISSLSSPEDGDRWLFHSNSCHSTFASSTSGESEQRLSLISANSEDLPIVETDV